MLLYLLRDETSIPGISESLHEFHEYVEEEKADLERTESFEFLEKKKNRRTLFSFEKLHTLPFTIYPYRFSLKHKRALDERTGDGQPDRQKSKDLLQGIPRSHQQMMPVHALPHSLPVISRRPQFLEPLRQKFQLSAHLQSIEPENGIHATGNRPDEEASDELEDDERPVDRATGLVVEWEDYRVDVQVLAALQSEERCDGDEDEGQRDGNSQGVEELREGGEFFQKMAPIFCRA